ncbi:MAG: hypothetical protein A2885_18340 [Sphingopyxis sp. RIFCSPHIGHO2_01_FULL_65_24]|nr:MAG: hypothetical protein A2885_18340 [Sphingopyxis sp. RIFCSPHIGHO2_01_FULL_65_24]
MIWGYVYIALMATVLATVLWIGDWECRIAVLTLFAGSALTLAAIYFSGSYFEGATPLLVAFDFLILAIFTGHALYSRRYWTLPVAALQLITCSTHLAKLSAPAIVSDAYSAGQGHWAYIQMVIILIAAIHVRARKKEEARARAHRP